MTNHRRKNKYLRVNDAMRAADKYTEMYGFKHRFYECDECEYYHIATVKVWGRKVLSLEALRRNRGQGE